MERLRAVIQDAFDAGRREGRREGADEARRAIMRALDAPAPPPKAPRQREGADKAGGGRAPRGSVRAVINRVLAAEPGLNGLEIEDRAAKLDPGVSPKSVGGELRRMRNKVYRQEGHRWFLIGKESAGPPEKQDPAGANPSTEAVNAAP